MSKAGEILEKIMMKVAFGFRIGNWSWRMSLSPVQGWLEGELLQLQWNWELWSTMVMPATLYWRDRVGERTPGNWRRKNWRRSAKMEHLVTSLVVAWSVGERRRHWGSVGFCSIPRVPRCA